MMSMISDATRCRRRWKLLEPEKYARYLEKERVRKQLRRLAIKQKLKTEQAANRELQEHGETDGYSTAVSQSAKRTVKTPVRAMKTPDRAAKTPKRTLRTPKRKMKSSKRTAKSPERTVRATERKANSPENMVKTPEEAVKTPKMEVCGSLLALNDSDLLSSWHTIGSREGLASDTDIAKFLVALYSAGRQKDRENSAALCVHCHAPLTLYCTSCQLPSQAPPPLQTPPSQQTPPVRQVLPPRLLQSPYSDIHVESLPFLTASDNVVTKVVNYEQGVYGQIVPCENISMYLEIGEETESVGSEANHGDKSELPLEEAESDLDCAVSNATAAALGLVQAGNDIHTRSGTGKTNSQAQDTQIQKDTQIQDTQVQNDIQIQKDILKQNNTQMQNEIQMQNDVLVQNDIPNQTSRAAGRTNSQAQNDTHIQTRSRTMGRRAAHRKPTEETNTSSAGKREKTSSVSIKSAKRQKGDNQKTTVNQTDKSDCLKDDLAASDAAEEGVGPRTADEGVIINSTQRRQARVYVYEHHSGEIKNIEMEMSAISLEEALSDLDSGERLDIVSMENERNTSHSQDLKAGETKLKEAKIDDLCDASQTATSVRWEDSQLTTAAQILEDASYKENCAKTFGEGKDCSMHVLVSEKPIGPLQLPDGRPPSFSLYECAHCGLAFRLKSTFNKHIITHFSVEPHTSPGLVDEKDLTLEDKIFSIMNVFVECSQCGKRYESHGGLRTHILRKHGIPEKTFVCDLCGAQYTVEENLIKHKRKLHPEGDRLKCKKCDFKCWSRESMRIHDKKHQRQNKKPVQCEYCGKYLSMRQNLSKHILLHKGEKPFPCTKCDRAFRGRAQLNTHIKSHHGEIERPFRCDQCGKGFLKAQTLKFHMYHHTGERPYKCTICPSDFIRKDYLDKHMRIHTGEKPYRCDYCGETFAYRNNLTAHWLRYGNKSCKAKKGEAVAAAKSRTLRKSEQLESLQPGSLLPFYPASGSDIAECAITD